MFLVGLRIVTTLSGKGDAHPLGMVKIPMIPSSPAINETCLLKVSDQFSNFSWHPVRRVSEIFLPRPNVKVRGAPLFARPA